VSKRLLGPLLSIVLLIGVGAAIFFSVRDQLRASRVITVHGLIGSEKEGFFKDTRVVQALRKGGFQVIFEKAGSRQIATNFDLKQYDFAFPAGVPAAEKIRREQKISKSYNVFFTPMAIASWKSIADILVANGVATKQAGYYLLNMKGLLDLIAQGKRWSDLKDNAAYNVHKSILITSTDIRKSNSAAMYLALASYVANHDNIVQNSAEANAIYTLMDAIFREQGFLENSSEVPFEDYLVMGMGKTPLVMIYESQFISRTAASNGDMTPDMVLMYPEPTIFTKHILVPLTANGERLGEFLESNPDLQRLAVEYGFRSNNATYFRQFVEQHQLTIPQNLVNVIEPPSYEILEGMIQKMENQ
jgi:hypothetical protein